MAAAQGSVDAVVELHEEDVAVLYAAWDLMESNENAAVCIVSARNIRFGMIIFLPIEKKSLQATLRTANFCREALARRKSSLGTSAEKFGNFCREVWELLQRSLGT